MTFECAGKWYTTGLLPGTWQLWGAHGPIVNPVVPSDFDMEATPTSRWTPLSTCARINPSRRTNVMTIPSHTRTFFTPFRKCVWYLVWTSVSTSSNLRDSTSITSMGLALLYLMTLFPNMSFIVAFDINWQPQCSTSPFTYALVMSWSQRSLAQCLLNSLRASDNGWWDAPPCDTNTTSLHGWWDAP